MTRALFEYHEYERQVHLARLLFAGEDHCLAERCRIVLQGLYPNPHTRAEYDRLNSIAERWVNRLIAKRLVYNNQSVPLFDEENDPAIVMQMIEDAGDLELTTMALLENTIFKCIFSFGIEMIVAGDGDAYAGIWKVMGAIENVCHTRNLNPVEALNIDRAEANTPLRSLIFRDCLSPEQWDTIGGYLTGAFKYSPQTPESIATPKTSQEAQDIFFHTSLLYFNERKYQIWPELAD